MDRNRARARKRASKRERHTRMFGDRYVEEQRENFMSKCRLEYMTLDEATEGIKLYAINEGFTVRIRSTLERKTGVLRTLVCTKCSPCSWSLSLKRQSISSTIVLPAMSSFVHEHDEDDNIPHRPQKRRIIIDDDDDDGDTLGGGGGGSGYVDTADNNNNNADESNVIDFTTFSIETLFLDSAEEKRKAWISGSGGRGDGIRVVPGMFLLGIVHQFEKQRRHWIAKSVRIHKVPKIQTLKLAGELFATSDIFNVTDFVRNLRAEDADYFTWWYERIARNDNLTFLRVSGVNACCLQRTMLYLHSKHDIFSSAIGRVIGPGHDSHVIFSSSSSEDGCYMAINKCALRSARLAMLMYIPLKQSMPLAPVLLQGWTLTSCDDSEQMMRLHGIYATIHFMAKHLNEDAYSRGRVTALGFMLFILRRLNCTVIYLNWSSWSAEGKTRHW